MCWLHSMLIQAKLPKCVWLTFKIGSFMNLRTGKLQDSENIIRKLQNIYMCKNFMVLKCNVNAMYKMVRPAGWWRWRSQVWWINASGRPPRTRLPAWCRRNSRRARKPPASSPSSTSAACSSYGREVSLETGASCCPNFQEDSLALHRV